MQRILFVVKAREFGGLEIVLLDWLSQVDYSKTSVSVCCYGTDTLIEKLRTLTPQVACMPLTVSDDAPLWRALPSWIRLFSSTRPDKIVFLEAMVGDFGVTPVLAAWLVKGRVSYLFEANWGRSVEPSNGKRKLHYGFLPGIGWYRHRETLEQRVRARLAKHTFVVSQGIKNSLVKHYGYPAERTSVLYHGVDIERYRASAEQRSEFRRANGIPEDAIVVVSHGRLVRRKRLDRLLAAFETLYGDYPNLWLVITAYGPLAQEMEVAVAESDARARVKLVGFQNDPTMILKASDIYALSSNDEGFGIALVEALATGLLCVATNGPGPTDILVNGENGFLVEPSVEGVSAGLGKALRLTPEERTQMIRRGRADVERRFEIGLAIRSALDAIEVARKS